MAKAPPLGHAFDQVLGPVGAAQWSSGLCDCCDDTGLCCLTCFCPCITFGQIAEIIDRGSSSCGVSGALYALLAVVTGLECIYSCAYRTKLRSQYNLPETPCVDICVHCWCESCALCQMHRELTNRGFDMNIGWQGNMERQSAATGVPVPPVPQPGMMR